MNHTSSVDLIAATLILEKLNCSKFVRYLSKTFNLLLPIAGYGFMLMGFAPLSRNNTEQDINRIKKFITLYLFRSVIKSINSDEKVKNFTPIGKSTIYVLAPRISGFYTLIQSMNKHLDEVLDITVCYSGKDSVHGDFSATSLFDFLWNDRI
ncbi:hypothetical protein HZS_7447 [Henneguya salminicola]|nr:hypothetical protein HZS_7447 [Henneguya salminicola]